MSQIDIITAVSGVAINNKRAVCSTLPTGETAKRLIRPNYPVDLTIENIQSKFADRFDNPSYYFGSNWETFGGTVDGCDID
jgi:hypothetical protein